MSADIVLFPGVRVELSPEVRLAEAERARREGRARGELVIFPVIPIIRFNEGKARLEADLADAMQLRREDLGR